MNSFVGAVTWKKGEIRTELIDCDVMPSLLGEEALGELMDEIKSIREN